MLHFDVTCVLHSPWRPDGSVYGIGDRVFPATSLAGWLWTSGIGGASWLLSQPVGGRHSRHGGQPTTLRRLWPKDPGRRISLGVPLLIEMASGGIFPSFRRSSMAGSWRGVGNASNGSNGMERIRQRFCTPLPFLDHRRRCVPPQTPYWGRAWGRGSGSLTVRSFVPAALHQKHVCHERAPLPRSWAALGSEGVFRPW